MLLLSMNIFLYDLVPVLLDWRQHKTVVKGRYLETVVIWRIAKFSVIVNLGAANDN